MGTTTSGWGPFPTLGPWWDTGAKGSYGINDWCSNPDDDTYWGFSSKYAFRSPNVSGRHDVPVFLDALFCDGYPTHLDNPPPFPDVSDAWNSNSMQFFCIDRHQGGVNCLFMDWSVRKVGLKELWKFKWSRGFDTQGPWTTAGGVTPSDWPEWMANFSDY